MLVNDTLSHWCMCKKYVPRKFNHDKITLFKSYKYLLNYPDKIFKFFVLKKNIDSTHEHFILRI
jgi:hypothetical protein